ncbi:PilZ domain-containing protein [Vibrio sp. S4M6]|uniref:PilZ domain-containing protein n=1 Tax=Vibrio sinus TaxID=2946865 RepID=UPI00202A5281|nr:PilZ domain-containing protein [Vibrio sinus]MCL9782760.1 PilZ domain-containing protein [Vibrio sinus]
MPEMSFKQKRQYFRLRYPKRARPVFRAEEERYSVAEVSEKGIRVIMSNTSILYRGMSVNGSLLLAGDDFIQVEGAILRFDKDEVIVKLTKGPSFKDMVAEQRRLKRKYPFLFRHREG